MQNATLFASVFLLSSDQSISNANTSFIAWAAPDISCPVPDIAFTTIPKGVLSASVCQVDASVNISGCSLYVFSIAEPSVVSINETFTPALTKSSCVISLEPTTLPFLSYVATRRFA